MAAWREIEASAQWYSAVGDTHPSAIDGSPCHCTFYLPKPVSKTASKLDWLRDRPDMQTNEGQRLLDIFESMAKENPKLDPLFPWLAREVKKGRIDLHQTFLSYAGVELHKGWFAHLADWFADKRAPNRQGLDIMQHDFRDIYYERIPEYDRWLQEQQAKADAKSAAEAPVVHDYGDGWTLRQLRPEDLKYEGDAMGHCVGGYGYGDAVQSGNKLIYSLRDPKHEPHATIEMEPTQWNRKPTQRDPETGNLQEWVDLPKPHQAHLIQIQGKGNEIPNPEYQKRLKQWFETLPEEDRPSWADDEPITDAEYFDQPDEEGGGHLGGYGPHGDYGLPDRRSVDWVSVLDNSVLGVEPTLLYEQARARKEIPELADALNGFHDEQLDNFDQWRDQNYKFIVPFPMGDEEYPYRFPNGEVVNNEAEHEKAAYDDLDQWEREHEGLSYGRQLYSLLVPHYQEAPAGQYVNELQGDPTAVAKAQNSDLRAYWQHPAQADWNAQQQPRQARWTVMQ